MPTSRSCYSTIQILYDFKQKQTTMVQHIQGTGNHDWNKASRAIAYTKGWQLYVRDADDQEYQLSNDGSREIVYGQSVHRNEFGIRMPTIRSIRSPTTDRAKSSMVSLFTAMSLASIKVPFGVLTDRSWPSTAWIRAW